MTTKTFVGRSKELSQINNWIRDSSEGLVLITGAGGIGKTSLLQEIKREYLSGVNFAVEYFDLSEQPFAIVNLAVHLANSLGLENFPEFQRKINNLSKSYSSYSGNLDDALDTCVHEATVFLNQQGKKLLHITDTFEIALKYHFYEDERVKKAYDKLRNIPGTRFVIAGRDKSDDSEVSEEIISILDGVFKEQDILPVPLSGFDEKESKDFFEEYDQHSIIPIELRKKLQLLTAGRPVLLSLAVEWFKKNIPLPLMVQKSLTDLYRLEENEAEWKKLVDAFESELVSQIKKLRTPFDIAILHMAHIDRRMDAELISILQEITPSKADEILKSLLKYSFVKESFESDPPTCTLHDEMRLLINRYAWLSLDITGEERRRLAKKVIESYYLSHIESLRQVRQTIMPFADTRTTLSQLAQIDEIKWKRWLLEAETVYYSIKVSEDEGFNCFDRFFYDEENSNIRDQFLIDELKRANLNKDKVALREADVLRRRGDLEKAKQIWLAGLGREDLSDSERMHLYNTLGMIDLESNPRAAEGNFKKALRLAISINDSRNQAKLNNNLGRLYRNISQLEFSITHFKQAVFLVRESENLDLMGTILNNLAWTYRLNGNLEDADTSCRIAIAENRRQGQDRPLAYSYLTKADIDRDRGDLPNAERHARLAYEIFTRLDKKDYEGEAQTYRTLASVFRQLRQFDQSLKLLETGISLLQDRNSPRLLASLYQSSGRTYRHYASYLQKEVDVLQEASGNDLRYQKEELYEKALLALKESISLAKQIGNVWEVARSQIEIVLVSMLKQDAYNETEILSLLDEVWRTAKELDNELLIGYVYENRARIELRNRRYEEAGRAFGQAAFHLSKRTGQEANRAFSRLHNVLLDDPLSNEQRDELAKGVLEYLRSEDCRNNKALIALMDMCRQIIILPI